jgi:hypothetical protein
MICFTAFPEIQSNLDIGVTGDCRWAKPTHRAAITHTHPQRMSLNISPRSRTTRITPIHPVPPKPPDPPDLSGPPLYLPNLLYL